MVPVRSNSRSLRWQGETLKPTRAARSVRVMRPSIWSSARIFRSIASTQQIIPQIVPIRGKLRTTFRLIAHSLSKGMRHPTEECPMATNSVLAFWAVALLLIVVPGADWAFTIGAALHGRSVAPALGGLVVGYAAMTLLAAA